MIIFLAAYTSPGTGDHGYRWVWKDLAISDHLLNSLYNTVSRTIPDVSALTLNDVSGGVIAPCKGYVAIYRFINGGRDAIGREGRFFLICGILDIAEASRVNLCEVMKSPEFCTVRDIRPSSTVIECSNTPEDLPDSEIRKLKEGKILSLQGDDAMKSVMSVFKSVSENEVINVYVSGKLDFPEIKVIKRDFQVESPKRKEQSIDDLIKKPDSLSWFEGPYSKKHLMISFILGFLFCLFMSVLFSRVVMPWRSTGLIDSSVSTETNTLLDSAHEKTRDAKMEIDIRASPLKADQE